VSHSIVLSIKPLYADAILRGIKHWEYRKTDCGMPSLVYLYAVSPIRKIVGQFYVESIQRAKPAQLWKLTGRDQPGVTQAEFFDYFKDRSRDAFALEVKEATRFPYDLDLQAVLNISPPRSFERMREIDPTGYERLLRYLANLTTRCRS
jgi:predicted transcriptional regulator